MNEGTLACLLLVACGPQTLPPVQQQPDPMPMPMPMPMPEKCEAPGLAATLEVPMGTRAVLAVPAGTRVTRADLLEFGPFEVRRLDALRFELKAPYEAVTATVKLGLHCADNDGAAEVAATTRAPRWSSIAQWTDGASGTPPNREYGNMWLDGTKLFVLGGFHYRPQQFTASTDLWSFDLGTRSWTQLQHANAAPEFMGARLVAIPNTRERLFLGGVDRNFQPLQHLEKLDTETLTWTSLQAQGAPQYGDYQPGVVFDSKRNRFLSVCGQSQMLHCNVMSLTVPGDAPPRWEAVTVEAGPRPAGRAGHYYAYDAPNDRVVIFAGMSTSIIGDTWALELGTTPAKWVKLADTSADLMRRNGAWALDEPNHRLIVWGGTPDGLNASEGVWFLDLDRGSETWRRLDPEGGAPSRASGMAVLDAANHRFIGGFGNTIAGGFPDLWALEL